MDAWEFLSLSRMLDEGRIWKGLLDGGDLAGCEERTGRGRRGRLGRPVEPEVGPP